MGQAPSEPVIDNGSHTKCQTCFFHSLKKFFHASTWHATDNINTQIKIKRSTRDRRKQIREFNTVNAIIPKVPFISSTFIAPRFTGNPAMTSKHSLVSLALSKLASFSKSSKHRIAIGKRFLFHKHFRSKGKLAKPYDAKSSVNVIDENNNVLSNDRLSNLNASHDLNNNLFMKSKLVKQVLSSKNPGGNSEQIYDHNLERFETLVTIAATSSDEDVDSNLPRRIITSSKNRVELDVYFMEWVKSKVESRTNSNEVDAKRSFRTPNTSANVTVGGSTTTSRKGTSRNVTSTTSRGYTTTETGLSSLYKSKPRLGQKRVTIAQQTSQIPTEKSSNITKAFRSKTKSTNLSQASTKKSKSYKSSGNSYTVGMAKTDPNNNPSNKTESESSESSGSTESDSSSSTPQQKAAPRTVRDNTRSFPVTSCFTGGSCGRGPGRTGAPPAYLDYGIASSNAAAMRRAKHDPVIDRLNNVDVVEELTYMVPNPCGNDTGEQGDDCEYFALCGDCGELEPLPEEVKNKIPKNKNPDSTPVTYSRRQRFNFKNGGDDDGDGPPYPYEGSQPGSQSCRCSCCTAGLRRNSNCECKCCQMKGSSRRCNSFDELPVGKNPEIRRILYPEEKNELIKTECDKYMPGLSGLYTYDKDKCEFMRQVPRTPTPIILEVPAPRRLNRQDLIDVALKLEEKKRIPPSAPPCPVEAEPIYLPPVYGQCNPCCTPCNPAIANQTNTQSATYSEYTTTYTTYNSTAAKGTPTYNSTENGTTTTDKSNSNKSSKPGGSPTTTAKTKQTEPSDSSSLPTS